MVVETLLDVLKRFEGLGNREAVRFLTPYRKQVLTYREIWLRIGAVSRLLSEVPVGPGDRVLLWAENSPEWIAAFWGGLLSGARIVPIDPGSSVDLVRRVVEASGSRFAFLGSGQLEDPIPIESLPLVSIKDLPAAEPVLMDPDPNDIAEVLFTSGTTGKPRGIVHRHRSLAANLRPFASEFDRYRLLAGPFQPIRVLSVLPLGHMFGQAMGLFIPPLLGGSLVLLDSTNPSRIVPAIRSERVSVLSTVPRVLRQCEEVLRRRFGEPRAETRLTGVPGYLERWWRHRRVHSFLGWKFWAVVSGGAALEGSRENFWSRLGILPLQGYGLTEAGPVISVNHPFKAKKGTVGKVLAGQRIRLAEDGEILVSGDSVSFELLEGSSGGVTLEAEKWLQTGDIGELDDEGNLHFKGRKKDLIVTSEGMNVFPEEVEAVLKEFDQVRDAAVVARQADGGEVVHAVLIPQEGSEEGLPQVIGEANRRLETHQRIRHWSIWPEAEFPRTSSTYKLRRAEIRERLGGPPQAEPSHESGPSLERILARLSGHRAEDIGAASELDTELGLSSLDRVELLQDLEELEGSELSESDFAKLRTVGELRDWLGGRDRQPAGTETETAAALKMPQWTRRLPFRWVPVLLRRWVIRPLYRHYIPTETAGFDHFRSVAGRPLIIAANHQSHMDTITLLAVLPGEIEAAPAVRSEQFRAYFEPERATLRERVRAGIEYFLAALLFSAFPLPQRSSGVRRALQYAGKLLDSGCSLLVFPEGRRSPDDSLLPFKPGVILMSRELEAVILPVRMTGLHRVMPIGSRWPQAHPVTVTVGPPFSPRPDEGLDEARERLEETFRNLSW